MTMWQSGGMGHSTQNNPWMKLMGIVAKERRHDNTQSQTGSNERALNIYFHQEVRSERGGAAGFPHNTCLVTTTRSRLGTKINT